MPVILPYYAVSKEFHYQRDIRDAVHLALQPEDLLFSSSFSRFYPYLNNLPFNKVSQNDEFKPGYLGFVFSFLVIYACWYCIKKRRELDYLLKSFLTIAFVGLILSFGPVLHLGRQTIHDPFLIPLPYSLFYYLFPGFNGFRNAARWEMLFILAIAVVIILVLHRVFTTLSVKKKIVLYSILIIAVIAEFNFPMQFHKVPQIKEFPPVYSWLQNTEQDAVIIEMPVYNWNMFPYGTGELARMYYATQHFRKMVNGGSGFTPPPWEKFAYEIDATFPSNAALERLQKMGVTYLVVHKNEYDLMNHDGFSINGKVIQRGTDVITQLQNSSTISFVKQVDTDYIFIFKKTNEKNN